MFSWSDGRIYKGWFEKGRQNGVGVMSDASRNEIEGIWKDGK